MAAFKQKGAEPLDAMVLTRLTASEKAALKEEADLAGLTMAELIRRRCLGRAVIASADAAMIRELRRLGGLLKHVNATSGGAYRPEVAAALAALKAYIEQLSRDRAP